MKMINILRIAVAMVILTILPARADYTLIVPQAPGQGTSVWASIIAKGLSKFTDEPVVVRHIPGARDKITAEIAKTVHLLEEGGTIFFRVNPRVSHDRTESRWIEFFAWNVPFIIDLAEKFNLKVLDIRDDANQRKYFVYRKI